MSQGPKIRRIATQVETVQTRSLMLHAGSITAFRDHISAILGLARR
jgi:hypothetical protein